MKYGFIVLKLLKFGTLISFALSFLFLAQVFGWQFGLGLLLLIAVHEFGHVLFAKWEGLPVSAPIFLGPLGALITMKRPPADRRQEAVVAIGGPVIGTAGALACFGASQLMSGQVSYLLIGLAYFGSFLNLFNLIPLSPLDGGRVAGALSKWANVAGLAIFSALIVGSLGSHRLFNPLLLIILLVGGYGTIKRFQRDRRGEEPPPLPARTRRWIAVAYVAMLAITSLGMSVAHNALVDGNYVPAPSSSTVDSGDL
ncbi:MAG: site-2 protease family protein [Candidatus Dormibacteria bacterium]